MRLILLLALVGVARSIGWSANLAPINVDATTSTVFNVTQDDELWFFNGGVPANYKTKIKVQAVGPSKGTFRWEVTTNKPAVALESGGSLATKTDDSILNVESKEISLDVEDVTLNFQYNGQNIGDYPLTVLAPLQHFTELPQLNHVIGDRSKDPPGFSTFASYRFFTQFQTNLPRPLEVNEFFDLDSVENIQSNVGWQISLINQNMGFTSPHPDFPLVPFPTYFQDKYTRAGVLIPLPETPLPPNLSTEEVFRVNQKYFTGSATPGSGRQSSFSRLRFFRDHVFPVMQN